MDASSLNLNSLIVVLVLIIIILLLGIVGLLVWLILRPHLSKKEKNDVVEEFVERRCLNHPERSATGNCKICDELFCEECLIRDENLLFCSKHIDLYTSSEWIKISTVTASPKDSERGLELFDIKKHIWTESKIPTYIETHYKIDYETDEVESHVTLFAREEDNQRLIEILGTWKKGPSSGPIN